MQEKDNKQHTVDKVMHEKLIEYIDLINIQLREPAANIFASLPLLANSINSQDTEKAMENLQGVYQKTYMILKGVNNMSLAARLLGEKQFGREIVDFSALVKDIILSSSMILPEYFNVESDIDSGCLVDGNGILLTAALLNIIVNSIDYKQEGDVNISVSLKKEKGRCILTYKDNSIGVKEELAQDIFKPFFTSNPYDDGEPSTKMGVGLFIARKAVEQAGGTMIIQTEFSEGVSYRISIPESKMEGDSYFKSSSKDLVLNRYSDTFIQLCEYCDLPDL